MQRWTIVIVLAALLLAAIVPGIAQDAPAPALVGPTWQWVETLSMDGSVTSVPTPETFTITFNEDGTYNALADCNRVNGIYTVDGSQLEIMPGMSTMAFCPNQELADQFTQELGNVASYLIEDGSLFLAIRFDSGIMQFQPAEEVTLVGPTWQWVETLSMDGSVTSVPTPETFTITFNEDGTFNALADCNRVNGTFTADDPQLEIVVGMSTMAFCPNQELADQFTQELSNVASYLIEDGSLFLAIRFDSGIMQFQPAEEVTLVGPTWQWVETLSMDGSVTSVPTPETFTITFNEDGTFNALADCNRVNGTFTADDPQLEIVVGMSTMAFCPNQELADQFTQELGDVASYLIEDGSLFLAIKFDSGIMEFRPAPEVTEVTGIYWGWHRFQSGDGSEFSADPALYQIFLNEDGTFNWRADCNSGSGTYTMDGQSIGFEIGASTLAMCPPESQSEAFLQYLRDTATFVMAEGDLVLNLKFDSGNLYFTRAG